MAAAALARDRWLAAVLRAVLDSLYPPEGVEASFHYFARDLLLMTCEWPASALPAGEANDALLSQLLERLMTLCGSDNTALLRENVSVLKRFIEMWGKRLHPRRLVVAKLVGSNVKAGSGRTELQASKLQRKHRTTGMFLLDALLANGFDIADPQTPPPTSTSEPMSGGRTAGDGGDRRKLLLNVKDATGAPASTKSRSRRRGCSARSSGGGGPRRRRRATPTRTPRRSLGATSR